jgi:F-type H+-transporting ATPase subunit a
MVAGHIMIKVIAGFAASLACIFPLFATVPVIFDVFLDILKLVVCLLQAYVFVVLSCMYLSESFETEQH